MARLEAAVPELATRVHSKQFGPFLVWPMLGPFIEHASAVGTPLIVVHPFSPARDMVESFSQDNGVNVIFSNGKPAERIHPTDMINTAMQEARRKGRKYLGIISSDLAPYIPDVVPEMVRRLEADPELATVGVAIDSVHDLDLLDQVRRFGMDALTPGTYSRGLPNNALSVHRVTDEVHDHMPEDFLFGELFEEQLGHISISGTRQPVSHNEEIERMLRNIKKGNSLKMLLLAGSYTLKRDTDREITATLYKKERRQAAADRYRELPDYRVSDDSLLGYLREFYQIDFRKAA